VCKKRTRGGENNCCPLCAQTRSGESGRLLISTRRRMWIPHPDSRCVSFFCVAVVSYSSRGSVRVARRPDIGRRAADVPIRVSPGRLARSTRCMTAGRPYLYLIYVVDQIACDFRPLAHEFFTRAYMRQRTILLIEVCSMINFFSFVRNNGGGGEKWA
jgi:hypothetical protein